MKLQSGQQIPVVQKTSGKQSSMNIFRRQKKSTPTLRRQILQRLRKSPHSTVTITYSQQNGDSRRAANSSKENGNLFGTNAWPKGMLARINLLQIRYRHRHARLPKKTPCLKNRPGLATFPKQIRLYARSLNQHLGMTLYTNYRKDTSRFSRF